MKHFLSKAAVVTAITVATLTTTVALPAAGTGFVTAGDRNWCC